MNDTELLREKIRTLKEKVQALNILIVDDEKPLREKTGEFMEKFFNKVDCAEDGQVALEMFDKGTHYDIVITDLQMPHMTGEVLIEKLVAIDPDLFIVVMTGTPDMKNDLLKTCDSCLAKPVGLDDMLNMMEAFTEKKKL